MTFHIKSEGPRSFTGKLQRICSGSSGPSKQLRAKVEGPYGKLSVELGDYEHLWICAGGIGVAPMINILLHLHKQKGRGTLPKLRSVDFSWVIKSPPMLQWFEGELSRIIHDDFDDTFTCTSQ